MDIAIDLGVRRTLATYCQTCDDGRFDEFGGCFTTDAVVVVMGQEIHGREAIQAWITDAMPEKRRGRHITINSLIDSDAEPVSAVSDFAFLAIRPELRISVAGRYHDQFRLDGGRWRFSRREIQLLGPVG
ncbi:MAG TPA: nuclear transport factor 2 family protein [Mycobacteriales bacterium]|jgi:hypothetical protein|nr:nuclear transport factor 2 family protein [Mycobacteriales bacterium]